VYATSCGWPLPEADVRGLPAGMSTTFPATAIGAFVDVGSDRR
jgi:hypothetical protein